MGRLVIPLCAAVSILFALIAGERRLPQYVLGFLADGDEKPRSTDWLKQNLQGLS
jgi:hypothetical protein